MKELNLKATRNTPEIHLNPNGMIKIKGRAIHENATVFFEPILQWINNYIKNPAPETIVDLQLEYFNSSGAKILVHILQKVAYVSLMNKKFSINWYYEDGDEDILERGQFFSSVLNVKFNFLRISHK